MPKPTKKLTYGAMSHAARRLNVSVQYVEQAVKGTAPSTDRTLEILEVVAESALFLAEKRKDNKKKVAAFRRKYAI